MKKINIIPKKRHVEYCDDLTVENLSNPVYSNSQFDAFKLLIKKRNIDIVFGEVNFLIRDKNNNLKYLILYCYIDQPNEIFKINYWINNKVVMPNRELVTTDNLIENELSTYYVLDFIKNYISINYKII